MGKQQDLYLFHKGMHKEVYKFLGAHPKGEKVVFRVWAPNAETVSVVGDFNSWDGKNHQMTRLNSGGVWEIEINNLKKLDLYKFEITTHNGKKFMKSDPYAFFSELRPNTASKIYGIPKIKWSDEEWLKKREIGYKKPINIYEIHLGSWKRKEDGTNYSYSEIAPKIVSYIKKMKYTHVEIMPISEYPLDESWGYQSTGYFSITSRYGNPNEFLKLVNLMHKNDIGVIIDIVPGHFCKNDNGLYRFDSSPLYEYLDTRISDNENWGTANFDLTKREVFNFIYSNIMFWINECHIDGIRMDAISNIIYPNYCQSNNKFLNENGGHENYEAINALKILNNEVHKNSPTVMLIAEDSSTWPLVTKYLDDGGLGFDGKWNMGWMNDTLEYIKTDPLFRKNMHEKLTFSFMYAFSENYILALSHDEVVHGKKSILNKMSGDYEEKFRHVKNLFSYQMAHPGKKLNFMGNEIMQGLEWRYNEEIEWKVLKDYGHSKDLQNFLISLNDLYLNENTLWYDGNEGFEWIEHENINENIIAFMRKNPITKSYIIAIFNFSGINKIKYKIGVPEKGKYKTILCSDDKKFGGSSFNRKRIHKSIDIPWNYREQHIEIDIAANSAIFIKSSNND